MSYPNSQDAFSAIVANIAKRDGVHGHVAMQRARVEEPSAFAAAFTDTRKPLLYVIKSASNASRVGGEAFLAQVEKIRVRDNCAPHLAMQKCRIERPDLFIAFAQN